jgi:dolichol-phosphate mannosyltransferase
VTGVWRVLALIQWLVFIRLVARLARVIYARPAPGCVTTAHDTGRVTVTVPVLNEVERLEPCLVDLERQGSLVHEIIVVDGGSTDGTQELVERHAARDSRMRLLDAPPRPSGWNGKAWGLQSGLESARPDSEWIVTVDADVRMRPDATSFSTGLARDHDWSAMSLATSQVTSTAGLSLLHPAMLTTLVYRFGIPGAGRTSLADVQANGQFAVYRRNDLDRLGGFARVRNSICEDVTLAREFHAAGLSVGFVESGDLARTEMHRDGWDCWRNWPRSLPLRDRFTVWSSPLRLAEAAIAQALPLPVMLMTMVVPGLPPSLRLSSLALVMTRLGVLAGTRRAYVSPGWTYWLSPLSDLAVYGAIFASLLRRRHVWRGQELETADFKSTSTKAGELRCV